MQVLTFNFLYIGRSDAAGVRPWPPRMTSPSRVQDLVQFCVIGTAVSIHTGSHNSSSLHGLGFRS